MCSEIKPGNMTFICNDVQLYSILGNILIYTIYNRLYILLLYILLLYILYTIFLRKLLVEITTGKIALWGIFQILKLPTLWIWYGWQWGN